MEPQDPGREIRENAHLLKASGKHYEELMELAGDARYFLLGEASHGTHELYETRAGITKQLISKKALTAVGRVWSGLSA